MHAHDGDPASDSFASTHPIHTNAQSHASRHTHSHPHSNPHTYDGLDGSWIPWYPPDTPGSEAMHRQLQDTYSSDGTRNDDATWTHNVSIAADDYMHVLNGPPSATDSVTSIHDGSIGKSSVVHTNRVAVGTVWHGDSVVASSRTHNAANREGRARLFRASPLQPTEPAEAVLKHLSDTTNTRSHVQERQAAGTVLNGEIGWEDSTEQGDRTFAISGSPSISAGEIEERILMPENGKLEMIV